MLGNGRIPKEVENKCIALAGRFSLNYCAIDVIVDHDGNYIFLEINPAGQFLFLEHADNRIKPLREFCRFLLGGEPDSCDADISLDSYYQSESYEALLKLEERYK